MDDSSSSSDSDLTLHPPGLTKPTKNQREVAEELIQLITFDEAFDNTAGKTIKTTLNIPQQNRHGKSELYCKAFRLDLQGKDSDKTFERYAIQFQDKTFAQVHIKIKVIFGASRIKTAFMESLQQTEDIWLK